MVAGHLREIKNMYYMVLSYKGTDGKRKSPIISTGLTVKGNKVRAKKMLDETRKNFVIPTIETEEEKQAKMLFADYMIEWLEMMRPNIEESTYSSYESTINTRIVPYFRKKGIRLIDLTAKHIQDYYTYGMNVEKVSPNTVIHRHANIRKALEHAYKMELIPKNPADLVQRPKKQAYIGSFYNQNELTNLFEVVRGTKLEMPVIIAAYYGLRRSEVIGLKWDAIDFDRKMITIKHTVTEVTYEGKRKTIEKDRTKNKSSYRSLPLIKPVEELLNQKLKDQKNDKRLCGKAYKNSTNGYVCVDEVGNLIRPNYITTEFCKMIRNKNMKKIRFHDLRHSCATLLLSQGIGMKDIQEWLGHADITTTSSTYAHYEYQLKSKSADAIQKALPNIY